MIYSIRPKDILTYFYKNIRSFLKAIFDVLMGRIVIGSGCFISRHACIKTINGGSIRIGDNCTICDYAMILTYSGNITVGNNSTVNPFCILYGHGGLKIGNGVRIAAHTVIIPASHNYEDPDKFIYKQGMTCLGIEIQDDVWIGCGARILDGVTIKKGAVIGSGAVVTNDVPEYAVVAGVPAEIVKYRKK